MYFFFVLVDRQKQEVVTQTANRWDRKKETQPTNFPQQQTNPYSPKVKTAMEAPPMRKSDDGLEKEKQNKHESAPFSTPYRNKRNQSLQTNTNLHIISIHFLSPQPIDRFSSVQMG